jgi:hypothetical protein
MQTERERIEQAIDEFKAAINKVCLTEYGTSKFQLSVEALSLAITVLQEIADGRYVRLPYKRRDRIYVVDDNVKKGYRTTRLNYYQVYADNTDRNVIVKTTAVEHWYGLDEIFSTLEAVKAGVEKMRQEKRESCFKRNGRRCSECNNPYCNAREDNTKCNYYHPREGSAPLCDLSKKFANCGSCLYSIKNTREEAEAALRKEQSDETHD